MRPIVLFAAFLLGGCGYQPAGVYRDIRDRIEAATGIPLLGYGPCARAMQSNGSEPNITEICYRLTAAQRWQGLWRNDFEGSRFCAAPAQECVYHTPGDRIWMDYSFGLTDTRPREFKVLPGGLYRVDFVG